MDTNPKDIHSWIKVKGLIYNIKSITIEDVRNIYGVSSASNFKFGFNYGYITGVLSSTGYPIDEVSPKEWQKHLGVTIKGSDSKKKSERKKEIGQLVSRIFPQAEIYTKRGALIDGRSDALGIGFYSITKDK